jgi:ERCC4-type nuclease
VLEKYKYTDTEIKQILSSINILVDSNEKVNDYITLWYDKKKIPYTVKKLFAGDYSFFIPANEKLSIPRPLHFEDEFCIERKANLSELVGNFASDRNRIEDEFLRCKGKMQLLIEESSYKDIYEGNYKADYSVNAALGTLHSFSTRYNVPFIFVNKEYTARYIYYTFYYYLRNLLK